MFLFKIWIFNIDFTTILSFLVGIIFGVVLFSLIYALLVIASLSDKKFKVDVKEDKLTNEDVKELINNARMQFKDKKLRGNKGKVSYCYSISKDLAYGIAASFYPNSKYPLLEISVDEAILLIKYIDSRIDDILNKKGIKLLKRLKISSILELSMKTSSVINSKAFHVTKDVNKVVKVVKRVLDVINPLNIGRRLIVDTSISLIVNKLCQMIIGIVGEETYKIYSKKVLNLDLEYESDIDILADELIKDLNNVRNDSHEEMKFKEISYKISNVKNDYKPILDKDIKFKEDMKNV